MCCDLVGQSLGNLSLHLATQAGSEADKTVFDSLNLPKMHEAFSKA